MPQFAFRATDNRGNTVEGTVTAPDRTLADEQVRQMGYQPIQVLEAAQPSQESLAVASNGGATAATLARPGAIDLTQPAAEIPASINPLRMPSVMEETSEGRLEPWQRGGPIEQTAAAPTMTMNSQGRVVEATQKTTPAEAPAPRIEIPRSERERAVRPGVLPPKSLWKRLVEVMVYPVISGVVLKDLAPFYRQFATLINAGLSMHQALVGLESNTQNAKLKEVARAGQEQVRAGGRFSDVMASYPWIFSPMQIELVRAAEYGGMLDQALHQIAEYIEHELELRRLVSRETFYPKFVLFIALMLIGRSGITGGQMAIVGLALGGMGKAQYTGADYLMDTIGFALMCLLPFLAMVAVFRLFLFNIGGVREGYDTFKMAIPGLGKLVRMFAIAKFMRTYAALYRAGFAMGTALEIAGDACGNAVIRNAAYNAVRSTEHGGNVSAALETTRLFPPMTIDMLRTGEMTGGLDTMLDSAASYFESEGKLKSHQLALVFGVIIFLIVAILIASYVIGSYTGYLRGVGAAAEG